MCVRQIKVKPTTKPTPTQVSNTYACLANDKNDDDDEIVQIPHDMSNQDHTPKVKPPMKFTPTSDDDDDDDDRADVTPFIVDTCKLRKPEFKRSLHATALLNLGLIVNSNSTRLG